MTMRAHQNPPKQYDASDNAQIEELHEVTLANPLTMASPTSSTEIEISRTVAWNLSFLAPTTQIPSVIAQSRLEKTSALRPVSTVPKDLKRET